MIPVSRPSLGERERTYLLDAFDSGWISSHGEYIEKAEHLLASLGEVEHAAVTSNGTTALHLALLALEIGPGDEVIIPSLTYVATLNAVLYVGATPVIVDVDPSTWCISVEAANAAINENTRAIVAVDLYGCPADYASLGRVAKANGLFVIADAAESLGAGVGNRSVGSLADITTFSFFGNKVVTSGEGGAVLTAHPWIDERVRQLRNQGNHPSRRYHHDVLGFNYRMTNLAAAILTAQLERLPELLRERSRVIDTYRQLFGKFGGVTEQDVPVGVRTTPWLYTVTVDDLSVIQRDHLLESLIGRGVDSRPVFQPVQRMPYLPAGLTDTRTVVASRIASCGISLPTFPDLADSEIERAASAFELARGELAG